jgi:hypothetical protein
MAPRLTTKKKAALTTTKATTKKAAAIASTKRPRTKRIPDEVFVAEEKRGASQRRARAPKPSTAKARATQRAGQGVVAKRKVKRTARTGVVLAGEPADYPHTPATPKTPKVRSQGSTRTGRSHRAGGHGARKAKRHHQHAHGQHHHHD